MSLFSCFSFKSRLIHIFSMILVSGSSLCMVPLNFSFLSFSSLIMMFTWYERLIKLMNSCNGLLVKRYLLERHINMRFPEINPEGCSLSFFYFKESFSFFQEDFSVVQE